MTLGLLIKVSSAAFSTNDVSGVIKKLKKSCPGARFLSFGVQVAHFSVRIIDFRQYLLMDDRGGEFELPGHQLG